MRIIFLTQINRRKVPIICDFCGKTNLREERYVNARKRDNPDVKFYCNASCSNRVEKIITNCGACGAEIERNPSGLSKSKSGVYFCNKSCAGKAHTNIGSGKEHPNYVNGKSSYRGSFLRDVCEGCGESRHFLLVVHHKDGDRTHNEEENMETLCCNCHACRHLVIREGKLGIHWGALTSEDAKSLAKSLGT